MPQNPFVATIAKAFGSNVPALGQFDQLGGLNVNSVGSKTLAASGLKSFVGANQSGATISNALATTYTGLCLSNPAASGKNLYVRRITASLVVAITGQIGLGLIAGFAAGGVTVHTTPVTPKSSTIGNAATPVAKVDAACTIVGTPYWHKWLGANTVANSDGFVTVDEEGGIIIPAGGYIAIGSALAASPSSALLGSFEWAEF
jgi:hypothetical protein